MKSITDASGFTIRVGDRFNKFTVVKLNAVLYEYNSKKCGRVTYWKHKCICDCGKISHINATKLKNWTPNGCVACTGKVRRNTNEVEAIFRKLFLDYKKEC